MQHEVFAVFAFQGVDHLLVLAGSERRHRQGLGLAAGEQCRAVGPRQNADLRCDGPDRARVAAINAVAAAHNRAAHNLFLQVLENLQGESALLFVGK